MSGEGELVKGSWIAIFAGLLNACTVISSAQVDVSVAPSKSLYIAGEPVFVVASITNTGTSDLTIVAPPPDSCISSMTVFVEGLSRSDLTPCADPNTKFCVYDGPPSQLVQIKPGAQYKMQRLMNLFYDLRQAGLYHAHVSFHLEFADRPALEGKYSFQQRNFDQRVALDVENGRAGDLLAAFSPIIIDLESADTIRRQYAQMVMLTLAPRFAEDRILAMADQQDSETAAMPALRKLGTPATINKLESIAFGSSDGDTVHEGQYLSALEQIKYLDERSLLPKLYEVTEENRWQSIRWAAASAAARFGHAEAVPEIAKMLANPDPLIVFAGAEALGDTNSRAAVGILISAIPAAAQGNELLAIVEALGRLTHQKTSSDPKQRGAIHKQWSDWWAMHGANATIYDPETCGVIRQL
jgi:hypothetical protein